MYTRHTRQQIQQLRQAAIGLFEKDLSNAEIARRLGVSRKTIVGWRQLYAAQGACGLQLNPAGLPRRINEAQLQQVAEALLQGPQAHGYPTQLWTLPRIADLIEKLTGVRSHPGHVWWLLRHLGFTCQKPEGVAKERNEAKIAHWVAQEWPLIKKGHGSEGTL